MERENHKTKEERIARLRSVFNRPTYRVMIDGRKCVVREPNDPETQLFLDEDGIVLGKPNVVVNFYAFPIDDSEISFSEWYAELIREWIRSGRESVENREWNESELKAIRYLRRYWSHSFVQFVLKERSNAVVWNENGIKVVRENDRVVH